MTLDHVAWRKSSYSNGAEVGECVEVAPLDDRTGVRDTKDRARGHLEIAPGSWAAFLAAVRV